MNFLQRLGKIPPVWELGYQFQLKGSIKDGLIQVSWRNHDGKFALIKIEEITWLNPETSKMIWPSASQAGGL
jgi:hypothetical protein